MVNFDYAQPYSFEALCHIMEILRSEQGCPWDAEQTHESIRDNLLEEACEAMEAIDKADAALLCEELGDVLLQVVFHAQMARQAGRFSMQEVTDGICSKLIVRHPHVFGQTEVTSVGEVLTNWEDIKRAKKGQTTLEEAMRSVATPLPPVMRAEKLKKLARRAGVEGDDTAMAQAIESVRRAEAALSEACEGFIQSCAQA